MAAQLASDELMHCTSASYGERVCICTLSHRQTYGYRRIRKSHSSGTPQDFERNFKKEHNNMAREKGAKLSTKLGRQQAQKKLHRLGFSYLASSFLYIVTKVKAFYNGFLGDVSSETRIMATEAPTTEAYFSVPVLPY